MPVLKKGVIEGRKRVAPRHSPKGFQAFIYSDNTVGILFSIPFIIGFLGFTIIPMCASLYFSFTNYNMTTAPDWIGLNNYIRMFTQDSRFYKSIAVTFGYVLLSVPIKLVSALMIALLLTRKRKFVHVYRSVYYFPSLVGGSVAVTLVWKELFASKGMINSLLISLGGEALPWFGNETLARWPLILLTIWQFGSSMLIFAAALKQIPVEYNEAANIDGAGIFSRFFRITLPCLSPIILFNLVMQTIGAFMSFTATYLISNGTGGPNDSTHFIALYIYNHSFKYMNMGYASAMSWVLLVVIATVTALIFKTSNYWVFYESKG